jgi:hypothetical protein
VAGCSIGEGGVAAVADMDNCFFSISSKAVCCAFKLSRRKAGVTARPSCEGAREEESKGAREQGSEGAREQGNKGRRE